MADPASARTDIVAGGGLITLLLLAAFLVRPFEGRELTPYRDIVGVLTVCYGHTGDVQARTYSEAECERLLASDLGAAWATVQRCYDGPMTPHQGAALVSLAYRTGPGAPGVKDGVCWLKSGRQSTMRRLANAGDWAGACAQFDHWVFAGGQRVRGLERRAVAERKLCEGRL